MVKHANNARPGRREAALSLIEPRFRELMSKGTDRALGKLMSTINQIGKLMLEFLKAPESGAIYALGARRWQETLHGLP